MDFFTLLSQKENESKQITNTTAIDEEEFYKRTKQEYDLEHNRTKIESLKQDIKARKEYASKIFILICFWLSAILIIVIFQGAEDICFKLSDEVLIALIGGTTINVLGIFIVVAKYIFRINNSDLTES